MNSNRENLAKLSPNYEIIVEEWQRVSLTPGLELHYRPATTPEQQQQIAGLVATANHLAEAETQVVDHNLLGPAFILDFL